MFVFVSNGLSFSTHRSQSRRFNVRADAHSLAQRLHESPNMHMLIISISSKNPSYYISLSKPRTREFCIYVSTDNHTPSTNTCRNMLSVVCSRKPPSITHLQASREDSAVMSLFFFNVFLSCI